LVLHGESTGCVRHRQTRVGALMGTRATKNLISRFSDADEAGAEDRVI
jgi:hypothetical protein